MNTSRRVVISFLIAAIVLFLGMFFWPFILNNIIQPAALVLWLLLRILVLGIHQKYFWSAVIFAAVLVLFRLLPQVQSELPSESNPETNTTIINIRYWRGLFIYNGQDVGEEKALKRQLISLVTSLYALKQRVSNDFRIHEALQQGTIPLPKNIHTFLFPQAPPVSGGPLTKILQSIRKIPKKWIHQWTGQEKTEHYQLIEEVLNFMETSLEIKNDDRKHSQNKH